MVTFNELGNLGRLGNQMFQIAAAVALAERNGTHAEFKSWDYTSFFQTPPIINPAVRSHGEYREGPFPYREIPYTPNVSLFGYYQSEKYFKDQSEKIREIFNFNDTGIAPDHKELASTSCSIHVRRTDYLQPDKQQYHPFPGIEYYVRAIERITTLHPEIKHFMVFSDDMKWCRDNFSPLQNRYSFTFISQYRDVKDMYLMSLCAHNIIANSSFSWWAAWLNRNPTKTIICPKEWFGPAFKQDYQDIYCPEWIRE